MSLTACMWRPVGPRSLQRLLHAAELAVEHLAAAAGLAFARRPAARLGASATRSRDSARTARAGSSGSVSSSASAQPRVVGGVGEQLRSFLADRLVEQLADLLQRAVEAPALAQPRAAARGTRRSRSSSPREPAAPRRSRSRSASRRRRAGQDGVAELVDGLRDVVGRGERVGPPCHGP